jgi:hypothetical protein
MDENVRLSDEFIISRGSRCFELGNDLLDCLHLFGGADGDANIGVVEADVGVAVSGTDSDLVM